MLDVMGRPYPSRSAGSLGLSLVELLIVISVIGLLMAMLLPAIGRVRESALGVRCAVNLHNVGIASSTYSGEWRGMVPIAYTSITWQFWYQLLAPYTDEADVVNNPARGRILRGCPKWRSSTVFESLPAGDWQWTQYSGYCETLFLQPQWTITPGGVAPYPFGCTMYEPTWWGTTMNNPLVKVTSKSSRPFIFDASHASVDVVGWWPDKAAKDCFQRHNGRGNVLFFDGRIAPNTWQEIAQSECGF